MNSILTRRPVPRQLIGGIVAVIACLISAALGSHPSIVWPASLLVIATGVVLLWRPLLGLYLAMITALLVPVTIPTGTEVPLNLSVLLVAFLAVLYMLGRLQRPSRSVRVVSSVSLPFVLFLLVGLLSLIVGTAYWDPMVPRSGHFVIVQLAQWGIFALSGAIMWLTGNLARGQRSLHTLTFFYLGFAGTLAIIFLLPGTEPYLPVTFAIRRAPFWVLLAGLTLGQLLFNRQIGWGWRAFLIAVMAAVVVYAFFDQRERTSNMLGVAVVAALLVCLRWPRLALPGIVIAVGLALIFRAQLYEFAGGDAKWDESGGSRLVLSGRVIEVTMRNPVTGLGPAAYRSYARLEPLPYEGALWIDPQVNSHNNYVDLFAQLGVVGLGLFLWFAASMTRLAFRLRARFRSGFEGAFINGMLACWAGSLVIMLLADWILPYVYNIGFSGFQSSVLVWLFLGGLLALEARVGEEPDAFQGTAAQT